MFRLAIPSRSRVPKEGIRRFAFSVRQRGDLVCELLHTKDILSVDCGKAGERRSDLDDYSTPDLAVEDVLCDLGYAVELDDGGDLVEQTDVEILD